MIRLLQLTQIQKKNVTTPHKDFSNQSLGNKTKKQTTTEKPLSLHPVVTCENEKEVKEKKKS